MINRREALIGMGAAALGAVATPALAELVSPLLRSVQNPAAVAATKDAANDAADERLRKDLARIASRADSEEGVPVFLACVNLLGDQASPRAAGAKLTALNVAIAEEFRRDAAAWERIQPNSPETDVGRLIQVLAERDFANGGTEQTS